MSTVITTFNPIRRMRAVLVVGMGIMLLMLPALTAAQSQTSHDDPRFADQRSACRFMEENIPGYDCDSATAEYAAAEYQTVDEFRFMEENTWDHQPVAEYQIIEPPLDGSTVLEYCRLLEMNIPGYDCAAVAEFASSAGGSDTTTLNLDRYGADVPATNSEYATWDYAGTANGPSAAEIRFLEENTWDPAPLLPPAYR